MVKIKSSNKLKKSAKFDRLTGFDFKFSSFNEPSSYIFCVKRQIFFRPKGFALVLHALEAKVSDLLSLTD
uniref:Uncharacterized protein n=1 Tax=Romanomermis culicivorax TaxID=13658 RepID=A0A915JFA0_ROMCU